MIWLVYVVLGAVMGWALTLVAVGRTMMRHLTDDAPDEVIDLSMDLMASTVPGPMVRWAERRVDREGRR